MKKSCQAAPSLLRDPAFIAVNVDKANGKFREALEKLANAAAADEWLRQDVVEGPPSDAYARLLAALARSKRLVIDDSEVEKWLER